MVLTRYMTEGNDSSEGCPPDETSSIASLDQELLPIFVHSVMLTVCILAMRLHTAGDDDLVRMMLASSSWSLAIRRTRRLHGAKMSVIGMSQTPNASISIAALSVSALKSLWFWFSSPGCSGSCSPDGCLHI